MGHLTDARKLVLEMQKIHDYAQSRNRDLTPEEKALFDSLELEYDRSMDLDATDIGLLPDTEVRGKDEQAIRNYLLNNDASQLRAAQTETTTGGGYLIPTGFKNLIVSALKYYGPMLKTSTIVETSSGNELHWPTDNDTGNVGSILGINTQDTSTAIPFSEVVFKAYKYTSNIVLVPNELMQDSAVNLNKFIPKMIARRIGRAINTDFTTGAGTSGPTGIVTAANTGVTAANGTSQVTAVTYDSLVDLVNSLDVAYRNMPGTAWMFSPATASALLKLKDSNQRPLWAGFDNGMQAGQPTMPLLGYPVYLNPDVADMAASAKSILFGDLSNYHIRQAGPMVIRKLVERYADYDQTAFIALARYDGNLIDAGTHPVNLFVNAAS